MVLVAKATEEFLAKVINYFFRHNNLTSCCVIPFFCLNLDSNSVASSLPRKQEKNSEGLNIIPSLFHGKSHTHNLFQRSKILLKS